MQINEKTVLFLVNDSLRAVRVSYDENDRNKDTIKKTFLTDLKVGEFVVVETATRHNATICKVIAVDVEVDVEDPNLDVGWVIERANLDKLDALRKAEKEAVEIIKNAKKKKAKEAMRAMVMESCGEQLLSLTASIDHE